MKISIVVPCYNEEKNLKKLISEFDKNVYENYKDLEVVLVNNGSDDDSLKVMEQLQREYDFIKIVNVVINQGYGFGILSGMQQATGDYIGWIHADLQFNPSEVMKGIEYLQNNNFPDDTVVKGLRSHRPIIDKLLTVGMSIYESIILHQKLWDINSQPTIIPRKLYEKWDNPPKDFSFDLYSYYIANKNNYRIYRYKVIQHKREEGKSSWNTGIKSRIKLIKRVLNYSKKLKNNNKTIKDKEL